VDQRGQCLCTDGYVNVQGQCRVLQQRDPCEDAKVRTSTSGALQRSAASVTLGTNLSIAVGADAVAGSYRTLLIPKQGTEVHDLSRDFAPSRTGTFSLDMEYVVAGGTAKRCTLLSSLTVQCRSGEQDVDGQCRAVARSACDQASIDVALAADAARGARSLVKTVLRLPKESIGLLSVVATPLQSAVEVPISQSGVLSGGLGAW
jgi:hypothetical protein